MSEPEILYDPDKGFDASEYNVLLERFAEYVLAGMRPKDAALKIGLTPDQAFKMTRQTAVRVRLEELRQERLNALDSKMMGLAENTVAVLDDVVTEIGTQVRNGGLDMDELTTVFRSMAPLLARAGQISAGGRGGTSLGPESVPAEIQELIEATALAEKNGPPPPSLDGDIY
jgi:hypothetical protein